MDNPVLIELLLGVHLLFVVLGMGPALYFDLRTLRRLARPVARADIDELHQIHTFVVAAFVGLWVSGAALIGVRTGFDLSAFTPKLWCKVAVVTVLAINAMLLHTAVFPLLKSGVGKCLIRFPARVLFPMTLSGGLSLAGWGLALALGSSQMLKVADWDTLWYVMTAGVTLCLAAPPAVIFGYRHWQDRAHLLQAPSRIAEGLDSAYARSFF